MSHIPAILLNPAFVVWGIIIPLWVIAGVIAFVVMYSDNPPRPRHRFRRRKSRSFRS